MLGLRAVTAVLAKEPGCEDIKILCSLTEQQKEADERLANTTPDEDVFQPFMKFSAEVHAAHIITVAGPLHVASQARCVRC